MVIIALKIVRQPNATQLCWRGLCLGVFIFTTAFQAFSQQTPRLQDRGSLIEAVNSAAPTSPSQLVDTPEAILLRERVILVYEKGDMAELSAVMRAHPPKEQAGQVIAQSLAASVKYSIVRIDDLVRIFMASLAWPDDRFDDVPRGQLSSNGVRSRLGTDIVGLLTEKGLAADPTNYLKSSQPAKWLQGHLNAARGKFGPEVDAALERALKVIDETPQALRNPVLPGQPIEQPQADQAQKDAVSETHAAWAKERSAGLVIDQKIEPESNEPRGTVTAGNLTIDLGETPPVYRHQLRTLECPVMLGDKHQRRSYEIYVTSFLIEVDGIAKKYPLHVTYPRWVDNGIQTSGGFVFVKNENPVTKIGVILPRVKIPGDMGPGAKELLEWQILVRVNDRSYVDAKTSAKEQTLGSDMVVLMPTHPEKIPASSSVVWFKFEKDGTVSLLDD